MPTHHAVQAAAAGDIQSRIILVLMVWIFLCAGSWQTRGNIFISNANEQIF